MKTRGGGNNTCSITTRIWILGDSSCISENHLAPLKIAKIYHHNRFVRKLTMQDELLRFSMLAVHVFPYTYTTSIWAPGNWPTSLRNCHVSLENLQMYHNDRFAYCSHWCKTATQDSYVGSDIKHALPTHEPSQWSCLIGRNMENLPICTTSIQSPYMQLSSIIERTTQIHQCDRFAYLPMT